MDDFSSRTYGTSGLDNRPLFGETSARDRIINMAVGGFTSLVVLETVGLRVQTRDRGPRSPGLEPQRSSCSALCGTTGSSVENGVPTEQVTVIGSFVFPSLPPRPLNVFFAVCILLACGSTVVLIFWYRQGDLEPKFRNLIYYMLASIVLLCLCANLYFHDVGADRK